MAKPAILVARAIFPDVLEKLAQHCTVESNTEDRDWTPEELVRRLALLYPKPMVSEDIKRGRLVALNIETPGDLIYPFHSVYRSDAPPGPAASYRPPSDPEQATTQTEA